MTSLLISSLLAAVSPVLAQDVGVASRHWQAGVQQVLLDRRAEARKEWEACLAADPDNEDCRAALKLLGAAVETGPAREGSQGWKAGLLFYEAGRYEEARKEWAECARANLSDTDCQWGLEKLKRIGADPSRSNSAGTLTAEAEALYKKGDYAGAYRKAKEALAKDPSNRVASAVSLLSANRQGPAAKAKAQPARPVPQSDEESRRSAVQHWNSGIIFFQHGDYKKARDEWLLCRQFDPANSDCMTGLQRIDSTYGGQ